MLLQRRWNKLLSWLVEDHGFQPQDIPVECREIAHAGNGLFARSACMPGNLLFAVPPKAMINKATLKRLYPPNARVDEVLTAVQLISMHLFIWRPRADEDCADPSFGPYISILPRNFGSHPLAWLVLSSIGKADRLQISLLNSLPPSVSTTLYRMHTRFWDDWSMVRAFLQNTPSITPRSLVLDAVMDFLWAWLNVNTRCIYYRLSHSKTDPDNLTMCPILDFANHTPPGQAHMAPVPSSVKVWNAAPVNSIGYGIKIIAPYNAKIEENDELLLTYGFHSNKMLFVEYGFVNDFSKNGLAPSGEVDVQDLVERYVFVDIGLCEAVRVALVEEGYWGDWTFHSNPDSAQPSWRLIIALRLYFLVVTAGSASEHITQPWRDVVTGKQYQISYENEKSWKKAVVLLCDMLIERAEKSIGTDFTQVENGEPEDSWTRWMAENIGTLWKEELFVARAVKECVLRGDEF